MSRGPRGPRKRARPNRPARPLIDPMAHDEDEIPLSETPEYKRRQAIIRFGTAILLFAFLSTSGITCVAGGWGPPEEAAPPTAANGSQLDPVSAEIHRYREAISKDPSASADRLVLAEYLMQRGQSSPDAEGKKDMQEAREQLEAALKQDPQSYRVQHSLGRLYSMEKNTAKAREAYQQALELASLPVDPKAPDKDTREANQQDAQALAHLGLAELAASEKKYDDALKHADAALKVNPGLGHGYILRGKVQYLRKQPEAARREFQLALDIAQNMPGGSQEQSSLLQQALQGMMLVDPQTATPTPANTGTPQAETTPAVTPLPPPLNVTAPVNSTTTNTSTNSTPVNATP